MEKYGFIYIWFDCKHQMYYIGCHFGSETDGYVCSSTRMRNAYRRRPEDFKRRVIQRHHGTRQELLEIEHRWLQLISDDQLGKKYYNLSKKHFGHWSATDHAEDIKVKMRRKSLSEEHIEKLRNRVVSQETRDKISAAGKKRCHSPETIQKMISRRSSPDARRKMSEIKTGKQHSEETKEKLRKINAGKKLSPQHIEKMRDANLGKKHSPETIQKMRDSALRRHSRI